jgi:hypothetical protein
LKRQEQKQIIFTGVVVRSASVHNSDERHARVEFTASWNEEIREEMQWDDIPETLGNCDLFGTLAISKAVLMPKAPVTKNGDMDQHAESFSATDLSAFNVVALKDKGGEIAGRELRFTLKSGYLATAGLVGRYISKLGRSPAHLTVTITDEEPKQTSFETGE